ncbi:MAG: PAS domain S-box protein [Candidatus Bipolaricaulota bacterium]
MRLEYGESFYGLLSASAPPRVIKSAEEKDLFEELAGDIAFGLHEIEIEELLRRSESKFRSYVENAPEGVFLADEQGNYLEVNEAGCKITSYSEKELLEMSIPDILPPNKEEEAIEVFKRLKDEREVRTELPFLRKGGNTGYMAVHAVRLSSGRFLAFTEDITERTEAYKQLQQSRRRFKDMADLLPLPIWEADNQGA